MRGISRRDPNQSTTTVNEDGIKELISPLYTHTENGEVVNVFKACQFCKHMETEFDEMTWQGSCPKYNSSIYLISKRGLIERAKDCDMFERDTKPHVPPHLI